MTVEKPRQSLCSVIILWLCLASLVVAALFHVGLAADFFGTFSFELVDHIHGNELECEEEFLLSFTADILSPRIAFDKIDGIGSTLPLLFLSIQLPPPKTI